MDISQVATELRRPMRRVPPLPIGSSPGRRLVRAATARVPVVADEQVIVEDATPTMRLYRPRQDARPAALLWLHGGGFVIGGPRQDDGRCVKVARDLGITVVSVDYRLAPDHPFPAALDDCTAAWTWIHEQLDPAAAAVGGASAGGGLAACLAQRLHASGSPVAAQWLSAPMLDDRTAARRDLDGTRHRIWSNRRNRIGWRSYLGGEPGAAQVPEFAVAARRADLSGLPPAWIGVGAIDLFHDEDVAYADRLRAAGVDVTLDVVPGAPHGFDSWAPGSTISRDYLGRACAWLDRVLG